MAVPVFKFYPALNVPMTITNSYPAVLTLFLPVNYVVNQIVTLRCPIEWGMRQIDGLPARIIAVDTIANTITVDVDTTRFDPYVIPWPMVNYAFTLPNGEINTLDAAVRDNEARQGYVPV